MEQLNCFQQTRIDKADYNLSRAEGIRGRQKLALTLVVITLPCSLNYFFLLRAKEQ